MKIIIDTDLCKEKGRDVDLVLYLLSFLAGSKITANTFEKARQQGYLKFLRMYDPRKPFPEDVELTDDSKFFLEGVMADANTKMKSNTEERFVNLANKMRDLFPQGNKPGYHYAWRDSTTVIVDRLKKFIMKYGDYSDEDILDATKRYVDSFNGNYTYMQLLKYFIWKNKVTGGELVEGRLVGETEKQSQLASYLENKEEKGHIILDWDVQLK